VEPIPETQYAQTLDGGQVAYQVAGSGATLMLGFHPLVGIDVMWEEPTVVRFLDRLSAFTRHAWFDPRGQGSSSSLPAGQARIVETHADDLVAVLDALGEERCIVVGLPAPPALVFAATHPARTAAVVLFDPVARFRSDNDYAGFDDDQVEETLAIIEREWGTGVVSRRFGWARDERLQRWYGKCERLIWTPREAAGWLRSILDTDVRDVLPTISAPTLLVARQGRLSLSYGRYVAEHIAGAKYLEVPADDYLVAAFDALDAVEEFVTGRLPEVPVDRVLATILFTDIVDSTAQAAAMGDRAWRHRLDEHDAMVRRHLARFRGHEIKTLGDGFLATFDGPARAIRCGCAIRDEARRLGIAVRAGLHTGEIELRGDDIGGVAVSIGSRIAALAGPAEVVVSRTVTDLVAGSGIEFADRGGHKLKGVSGTWRLFAVAET
jgi:class 3 adenylate cyclase/pimeloyl-ACP methyl ester carboxylesterase